MFIALILVCFATLLFCGCKENKTMRCVLFDKSAKLDGYIVFRDRSNDVLNYFDLSNNQLKVMPFPVVAKSRLDREYGFFVENNQRYMINYELIGNALEIQFFSFPDLRIVKRIDLDGLEIDDLGKYYMRYFREQNEFCYRNIGEDVFNLVDIETKEKRVFPCEYIPRAFYNGQYIGNDYTSVFTLNDDFDNKCQTLVVGDKFIISEVMGKIMYKGKKGNEETIQIYDLKTEKTSDTGLHPMKWELFNDDKYKYSFLGHDYILYGVLRKNICKRISSYFFEILSGGFNNDPPTRYMIYDLAAKRNVGYLDGCTVLDILVYF